MVSVKLQEVADKLNAVLHGDGETVITGIASIAQANKGQITFLSDSRYNTKLAECLAGAVILTEESLSYCKSAALVVKDPYLAYAKAAQIFDSTPPSAEGIAASATIAPNVVLGKNVSIGANAIIESGVIIGDGSSIGAGCFIGKNSNIGKHTKLWANVSVYHNIIIGNNVLIQSGSVIGADGFGYANEQGKWIKIPQLGNVIIGNEVEIGACTTIDRGALEDTIIGNGVIIDNQCQIAHNVVIGDHTAVAGGVIMAGSLKIGRYCLIGGASVINGHMEICDKVTITGMGMVIRPISEPGVYSSGIPLQPNKVWRKTAAQVLHINELYQRVRELELRLKNEHSGE